MKMQQTLGWILMIVLSAALGVLGAKVVGLWIFQWFFSSADKYEWWPAIYLLSIVANQASSYFIAEKIIGINFNWLKIIGIQALSFTVFSLGAGAFVYFAAISRGK